MGSSFFGGEPRKFGASSLTGRRIQKMPEEQVESKPLTEEEKEAKKLAKKQAKEEEKRLKAEKKAAEAKRKAGGDFEVPNLRLPDLVDIENAPAYGNLFIQCEVRSTGREFQTLSNDLVDGTDVWMRCRMQKARKQGNTLCFMELRQNLETVQAVANGKDISKFCGSLSAESVVDVLCEVTTPPQPIQSCTLSMKEMQVKKIYCVSRSADVLPFQLADASLSEAQIEEREMQDGIKVRVAPDTRLNNRVYDLRTVANQGIMRISSGVAAFFREYLSSQGFVEIHSPKLMPQASEGGADVFRVDYFPKYNIPNAFLAQSPQLHKQMALMTDLPRVFEIGPVFRSEDSFTHRHMTEFVGADMEMHFNEHYSEVLDMLDATFNHIFTSLNEKFKVEIETVRKQYPFEDLKWKYPCLKMTFPEAMKLLREEGPGVAAELLDKQRQKLEVLMTLPGGAERKDVQDLKQLIVDNEEHAKTLATHPDDEDVSTKDEKVLGKVILKKYGEEFYIIDKFPLSVRPFYTMPDPENPTWSNSYDIFLRGEEIMSGAQRIHEPELLYERAAELGVDLGPIQFYVDAFKYGAFPHAGGGVGLERVVMLFLGLDNIRKSSMFPRDPKRLSP